MSIVTMDMSSYEIELPRNTEVMSGCCEAALNLHQHVAPDKPQHMISIDTAAFMKRMYDIEVNADVFLKRMYTH